MNKQILATIPLLLLGGMASAAPAQQGVLRIEIHEPAPGLVLTNAETSIAVEGGASIFGGVRYLDLFLVLDTSRSLQRTDPRDFRKKGAIGLVESLSKKSDIQIGVVDFDRSADLLSPLTGDRRTVVEVLRGLKRAGRTDLAAGIEMALAGFERGARADSSRVMLLFTDGRSDDEDARRAAEKARRMGVAVHTLQLGSDRKGKAILSEMASITGGSFLRVTDPSMLPEAFLNLRTTGIERVTLRVNDSLPRPARLTGGSFSGRVPLRLGENRIVAAATSLDGETREVSVTVSVSGSLSVGIEMPLDGMLLTEQEAEIAVEGSASVFANASPELMAAHPDAGMQSVVLRVNDGPPFATTLSAGRFQGRVMLGDGENRIVATATSRDGRIAQHAVTVTVRSPGCAELRVQALRDGRPALSISDRAVELVFDASNSMWGRMQGKPKISIAKEILRDTLDWLPRDLTLALRVYGHQDQRELRNCEDSELLVPLGTNNRGRIQVAIGEFRPRGQTPLAYSLQQVADDLAEFGGERAVVLVTDGIESCGGDPVAAARALQEFGSVPIHVISFGMGSEGDEDPASLRAIAQVSGGRFLTARSAEELREALSVAVGTAYRVRQNGTVVAEGALGADNLLRLPAGEYQLRLESVPPLEVPITLASEEAVTLVLRRQGGEIFPEKRREPTGYITCAAEPGTGFPAAPARRGRRSR